MKISHKTLIVLGLILTTTAHAATIYPMPLSPWQRIVNKVKTCKLDWSCYKNPNLGATITTINASDLISNSRAVINTNFTNLNTDKIEVSTTSVGNITELANLATVGTITSGTWNATAIAVNKGGSGTTSPSTYQVILGNGSNGFTVASGTGSSGQVFTSNGAGAYPSWQSSSIDQNANYNWTGLHDFAATTTMATTTLDHLGVGTSSPSELVKAAIGGDLYITGGLGIGTATTSDNNLVVTGLASTSRLIVDSLELKSEAGTQCNANSYDTCTKTTSCTNGKKTVGGGFSMSAGITNGSGFYSYPSSASAWTGTVKCNSSNCGDLTLTTYVICF